MTTPRRPPLSLRLPADLDAALRHAAVQTGRPRNALVIALVRDALVRHVPTCPTCGAATRVPP